MGKAAGQGERPILYPIHSRVKPNESWTCKTWNHRSRSRKRRDGTAFEEVVDTGSSRVRQVDRAMMMEHCHGMTMATGLAVRRWSSTSRSVLRNHLDGNSEKERSVATGNCAVNLWVWWDADQWPALGKGRGSGVEGKGGRHSKTCWSVLSPIEEQEAIVQIRGRRFFGKGNDSDAVRRAIRQRSIGSPKDLSDKGISR